MIRAALLVLPLLLAGCAKWPLPGMQDVTPKVSFHDLRIRQVDFQGADAVFIFDVANPNPVEITVANFTWDLDVAGDDFLSGREREGTTLAARGSSKVRLPVSLAFADLIRTAQATKGEESVPYVLSGDFGFNTPIGEVKVPYRNRGDLPVLKAPGVRLKALRVASFKPLQNDARLELDVGFVHKQGPALGLAAFDYAVDLSGSQVASGVVRDAGTIASGDEQVVTLPMQLDLLQLGSSVVQAISNKSDVQVGLDASVDVGTPWGDIPFQVQESRRLDLE